MSFCREQFLCKASYRPWDHMISSRHLIGPPSLPPSPRPFLAQTCKKWQMEFIFINAYFRIFFFRNSYFCGKGKGSFQLTYQKIISLWKFLSVKKCWLVKCFTQISTTWRWYAVWVPKKALLSRFVARGTMYCWAWGKDSFETNNLTMFLKTEATFNYCNWSIKMAKIIGFG